jgi:hypothetical protein
MDNFFYSKKHNILFYSQKNNNYGIFFLLARTIGISKKQWKKKNQIGNA